MDPFSAIVGGGALGFFGAGLAHVLTTVADRLGSGSWLRGPFGPQFFNVSLYTGVFYAAIGAAAGRRAGTAAMGFMGTFFGIVMPLFVLTRYGGWGIPQWRLVFLIVYVLAIWGTVAGLGFMAGRVTPWRGVAAAVLGSLAGYAVLAFFLKVFTAWAKTPWTPASIIPSPVNLLDGLLSGAGLCLGLSLDERLSRRMS